MFSKRILSPLKLPFIAAGLSRTGNCFRPINSSIRAISVTRWWTKSPSTIQSRQQWRLSTGERNKLSTYHQICVFSNTSDAKNKYPIDSLNTLELMHETARRHLEKRQYEQAISLLEECLKSREKVLGELHPITLTTLHDLGVICGKLNRHEQALSLLNDCLEKRERIFGERDENTLQTMFEYGYVCCKFNGCVKVWDRCLALRSSTLGPDHLETIRTIIDMAVLLYDLGRLEDALVRWEESDQQCLKVYESEGPLTQVKIDQNIFTWETRLKEHRASFGEYDPETLSLQYGFAEYLGFLRKYNQAFVLLEENHKKHLIVYGSSHSLTIMNALAMESIRKYL